MTTTQIKASADATLASLLKRELKAFKLKEITDQHNAEETVVRRRSIEDRRYAKEIGCSVDELNGVVNL